MKHTTTKPDGSGDSGNVPHSPATAMGRLWSRTRLLKEVSGLLQIVGNWAGMQIAPNHKGICLSLGGVILGQVRWNGRIDLPFEPEVGKRLVAEDLACRDPDSHHVVFIVRTEADVERAVWLLRLAYLSVDPGGVQKNLPCSMRT
jgi:hypothetical protein